MAQLSQSSCFEWQPVASLPIALTMATMAQAVAEETEALPFGITAVALSNFIGTIKLALITIEVRKAVGIVARTTGVAIAAGITSVVGFVMK